MMNNHSKSIELVISAFNRDYTNWIGLINDTIKITIYRKGDIQNIRNNETYIADNVGRDVHTFFYHISNNYYNLADYTFTSQDYPFDHVSNYISIINGDENTFNQNAKLSLNGCWFFNTDIYHGRLMKSDKFGCPNHCGLNIEEIWNELFDVTMPDDIYFVPAGHFCISKEAIRVRPLSFYKKIKTILENNVNAPWIIERLESYIFNINYKIK